MRLFSSLPSPQVFTMSPAGRASSFWARLAAACAFAFLAYSPSVSAQESDPTAELCVSCCLICCCGGTGGSTGAVSGASSGVADKMVQTAVFLWSQDELRSHDGRAAKTEMPLPVLAIADKRREQKMAVTPKRTNVATPF